MKKILFATLTLCCVACQKFEAEKPDHEPPPIVRDFESEKWKVKLGDDYPHRAEMLGHLMRTDTLRHKTLEQVKQLLGEPTRVNEGYVYYTISQDKIGFVTTNFKSLVLKLSDSGRVEKILVYN